MTSAFDNLLLAFLDKCVDKDVSFNSMSFIGLCFANGRFKYANHSDPFAVSKGASISFSRDGQNIAPAVSEINSANAVPLTVIASASSVPSMSTSPEKSPVAASNSPVTVKFLIQV